MFFFKHKVAAKRFCKCNRSYDWHIAKCIIHCLRGIGEWEKANRQVKKGNKLLMWNDFYSLKTDEREESGKKKNKAVSNSN